MRLGSQEVYYVRGFIMKEVFKELWGGISMQSKLAIVFLLGFLACGLIWLCSCSSIKEVVDNVPQDSIIEECVEGVIENYLGIPNGSLDLTPSSPEK